MGDEDGRGPAEKGKTGDRRKEHVRYPVAPPDDQGPGAERKIMVILILLLVCAVLGVAAGVMVVVSRNAQGGTPTPDAGALLPILALIF
jgi:hypothetical protein